MKVCLNGMVSGSVFKRRGEWMFVFKRRGE